MECGEMFAQLSEYIDGEADRDVREAIETHMEDCVRCEEFLLSLKKTVELARVAPKKPLPSRIKQALHEAIRQCVHGQNT